MKKKERKLLMIVIVVGTLLLLSTALLATKAFKKENIEIVKVEYVDRYINVSVIENYKIGTHITVTDDYEIDIDCTNLRGPTVTVVFDEYYDRYKYKMNWEKFCQRAASQYIIRY